MKAFQFSLEQILELRLEQEQEAEVRLGRVVSEWNRISRQQQDCVEKKQRMAPARTPEDIFQSSLYSARLDQQILRFQQEMDRKEPLLEKLREEYRQARAAREGLDKLKAKRKEEHRKRARKKEELFLDDLSQNMTRMRESSE